MQGAEVRFCGFGDDARSGELLAEGGGSGRSRIAAARASPRSIIITLCSPYYLLKAPAAIIRQECAPHTHHSCSSKRERTKGRQTLRAKLATTCCLLQALLLLVHLSV